MERERGERGEGTQKPARLRSSARLNLTMCVCFVCVCVCVCATKCDNSEKTRTANKMAKVAYFNASLAFLLGQLSQLGSAFPLGALRAHVGCLRLRRVNYIMPESRQQ